MAPERRSLITSEATLTAEEVQHRTFATTFRGLDPGEVKAFLERVAKELRSLRERNQELEQRLRDAESRAAHPELDETTLMNALGEETARVIRSAHEAAADIRAKAEENAQRILREGHEEANRLRSDADRVLTVRTEEADAAAASIREAAESWGEAVRNRASEEAAKVIDEARAEGRRMVEEAQAVRAKVLGDLSRKRRVAAVQVEQLWAGRERLLESYRLVRSTLDEVTDDLQRAEAEARTAASAAATKVADIDDVSTEELEAALREVRELESSLRVKPEGDPGPPAVDAEAVPEPGVEPTPESRPEPTKISTTPPRSAVRVVEVGEAPPKPEPAPAAETGPAADEAGAADAAAIAIDAEQAGSAGPPSDERRGSSLRILRRPKSDDAKKAPSRSVVTPTAEGESVRIIRPAAATAPAAEPDPKAEPEPRTEPASADAVAAAVASAVDAPAVDELFARIRADREQAVAEAEQVLAEPARTEQAEESEPPNGPEVAEAAEAAGTAGTEGDAAAEAVPDADEGLLQRRDAALEGIEQQLARKLKRALQDDQNDLLDRLRKRGKGRFAAVLGTHGDQAARFRDVSGALLDEAARAGVGFAGPAADAGATVEVADLAGELADSLAGPLRGRLEQALQAADDEGEDEATAVERIGMAYREWKAQRIERLAGDQVVAAFTRGTFLATPDAAPLRWVVSDLDGPCPDCDDNALAGPTPRGEAYPTGQPHPPAHAGCRCLLAPASH